MTKAFENLSKNQPNSKWFDDNSTEGVVETRDDIIKNAIISGIDNLKNNWKFKYLNPDQWAYGFVKKALWAPLHGIESFGWDPVPIGGSSFTVNPAASWGGADRPAQGGASERVIYDFSGGTTFDTSLIVIPGGSSGDPVSEHYDDQLKMFLEGEYHPFWFYPTPDGFEEEEMEGIWIFTSDENAEGL